MRDISAVAEQLREVREAQHKFMGLWAVEQAIIRPALDRVAADVEAMATLPSPRNSHLPQDDCESSADE